MAAGSREAVAVKQRVLVVIHHDAFALQQARWARVLHLQQEWEPVIYITADYLDRHLGGCRADGITVLRGPLAAPVTPAAEVVDESDAPATSRQPMSVRRIAAAVPGLRSIANAGRRALLVRATAKARAMKAQMRHLRELIQRERIAAVLLAESGPDFGAPLYVRAAHDCGIPAVTSPIEISTARDYAEAYMQGKHLSMDLLSNRLIAARYPRWAITHKRRQMVRSEASLMLASEWLGVSPPHPWVIIGNSEDVVAVEGEAMFFHYQAEGVPLKQMAVVGRGEHDIMFGVLSNKARRKEALYDRLGLDPKLPLLLSPLVQEHYATGRPECDFQKYEDMLEFWVSSLAAVENYNVVVTLHPGHTYQQDASEWNWLEKRGLKICRDDLPELVPLCDIYVTGGSTTTSWAIACGKPVINYDIYRHGAHMVRYRSALGVLSTQEQKEFQLFLKRLTSEPDYYAEVAGRQAVSAGQWGRIDGKAGDRLTTLFDRLLTERPQPANG